MFMSGFLKSLIATLAAMSVLNSMRASAVEFDRVGLEMTRLLQNDHYARLPFDEKLSKRILTLFLESLDEDQRFFLKTEVDAFHQRYDRVFHEFILAKKYMPVATSIVELYQNRVKQHLRFVQGELKTHDFKFESSRMMTRNDHATDFPESLSQLEVIWRDQLEDSIISEILRREQSSHLAREDNQLDFSSEPLWVAKKIEQQHVKFFKRVEGIDEADIANYFLSAVAKAHDPHSDYLSAAELESLKVRVSHELVGIGVRLVMNDSGEIQVQEVVNGGNAERQGSLILGDHILAISPLNNGHWVDVTFKPLDKIHELMMGDRGSYLGLRVRGMRNNAQKTEEIAIQRGLITLKDDLASAELYEYHSQGAPLKLAVIKIPSFYFDFDRSGYRASTDVARILERLEKEEVSGIILDLRDNGGGSVREVQKLTGFFVGSGPVVQVKSTQGRIETLASLSQKAIYDGPLVVMVNERSASATEILAAALQDYHRAVIVGSHSTFGKGTVQKTVNLSEYLQPSGDSYNAGYLKYTFQKYYRVTGSSVQIKGVVPDLVFPSHADVGTDGEKYEQFALPYDVIAKSAKFQPFSQSDLHLPLLQERSRVRCSANQDLSDFRGDLAALKKEVNSPQISLNLEVRRQEARRKETIDKKRYLERVRRFHQVREQDQKDFRLYRLTLEDLDLDALPVLAPRASLLEDNEAEELRNSLNWPRGFDLFQRESLQVLRDLVQARQ